jgi:predicted dehydrogenase
LRFAVIGAGYWGPNIIRNVADLPVAQLAAVCDKLPDRLERVSRRYPSTRVTQDWTEILKDPFIDAVAVATPVSTHYALARQALLAGKHVFVEKPLAVRSDEAEDLTRLARRKGLVLMVDHVFVYSPAVQKIGEIIRSGQLGDLYYFDSVRVNLGLFQKDINVIWDLAPHDLSIMDFLLGSRPRSLSATAVKHIKRARLEDVAYITVRYANGLIGHVHVNWLAPAKIRRILIGGSKRMVVYDDTDPVEKVKVYDKGVMPLKTYRQVEYRLGDMWAPHLDSTEALRLALKHFVDCVRTGRRPLTDGDAGARVVRLLEASTRSARLGGREIPI